MNYETHEYDVLVVGAGGAGLRAAIEASAGGATVGLLCKSLLGKAHTVMAEGGIAAALANVDDRDSWKVHFADTMRGGQNVNNWRMAEIHAREAPDRVRELEAWGAVFDRTTDGRILVIRETATPGFRLERSYGIASELEQGEAGRRGHLDHRDAALKPPRGVDWITERARHAARTVGPAQHIQNSFAAVRHRALVDVETELPTGRGDGGPGGAC